MKVDVPKYTRGAPHVQLVAAALRRATVPPGERDYGKVQVRKDGADAVVIERAVEDSRTRVAYTWEERARWDTRADEWSGREDLIEEVLERMPK